MNSSSGYFTIHQRSLVDSCSFTFHTLYFSLLLPFIMPILPRLRLDIALGLIIAGTIWYIGSRPRQPRNGQIRLHDEENTNESESAPIVEGSMETLRPLLMDPALLERIMQLSDPRTMIRVAQVSECSGRLNMSPDRAN